MMMEARRPPVARGECDGDGDGDEAVDGDEVVEAAGCTGGAASPRGVRVDSGRSERAGVRAGVRGDRKAG